LLLEPDERPLSLCQPEDPLEPLLRLGSSFQSSERPMFWPKLLSESLFFPMFEDVLRFTSPEGVFFLILSRSRFSICTLL